MAGILDCIRRFSLKSYKNKYNGGFKVADQNFDVRNVIGDLENIDNVFVPCK